jgi:hypothetical protein
MVASRETQGLHNLAKSNPLLVGGHGIESQGKQRKKQMPAETRENNWTNMLSFLSESIVHRLFPAIS